MYRLALLAVLFASVVPARADDVAKALEEKITTAARKVGPAVVCIYVSRSEGYAKAKYWGIAPKPDSAGELGRFDAKEARKKVPEDVKRRARILRAIAEHDLSDPDTVPESYGSGVVIDKVGLVLTCAHVVKDATKIYVRIGKGGSWADIHAADPRSDLAVLKLLDPPKDLAALDVRKGGTVEKGQSVLCLTNAYSPGFRGNATATITAGLISNLRKRLDDKKIQKETDQNRKPLSHYGLLLETSSSLRKLDDKEIQKETDQDRKPLSGCSGGVLLDLDGKLVGLTTALAGVRGEQPGGLSVPIDPDTSKIVEVLAKGEEVEYGFLGVVLGENQGMSLVQVSPGSPASRAGLRAGDRVVSINGKAVHGKNDLFLYLGLTLAGNTATIEVSRSGRVEKHKVTMAKYWVPGPVIASKRPPATFGLRIDYLSIVSQRDRFWNWSRMPSDGVVVREVVPGSPADKALLQPDKIITHVNGKRVSTPADYYAAVAKSGDKVELTTQNSDGKSVVVKLEK